MSVCYVTYVTMTLCCVMLVPDVSTADSGDIGCSLPVENLEVYKTFTVQGKAHRQGCGDYNDLISSIQCTSEWLNIGLPGSGPAWFFRTSCDFRTVSRFLRMSSTFRMLMVTRLLSERCTFISVVRRLLIGGWSWREQSLI